MDRKEIKAKISEGALRTKTIIEVVGWPKEHVSKTVNLISEKVGDKFIVIDKEVNEPKKVGDKAHSGFIELELLFENLTSLLGFIFDYMPSSVEIIEPKEVEEKTDLISDLMNDLAAKLHQYDSAVKKLKAKNNILKKKLNKKEDSSSS